MATINVKASLSKTISDFKANDVIKLTGGKLKNIYALSNGKDVVVETTAKGKITLKYAIGKVIAVSDSSSTAVKYVVGKSGVNNTFTWANGVRYVGSGKTDILNVNTSGGTVDLTNTTIYKSIDAVNASKATKAVTIKGGSQKVNITGSNYNDTIKAGSKGGTIRAGKGNDTIYAGAGADTIQYAKGEGSDVIYNISSSDKIKFVSDSLKSIAAVSKGTDVVITTANGSKMTLKAATGKTLNVVNSAGTTTKYAVGRNDANNAFTWASGVRFIGTGKTDTLNVNTAGGTVDLTNTTLYKSIDAVNASKATKSVTIKGGSQKVNITGSKYNDTIKAGSKGGTIIGGKGDDNIYAGAGADIIKFSADHGNDTVYNYNAAKDTITLTSGSVFSYKVINGKGIITTNTGTITLEGYNAKTVYVTGSDGVKRKYTHSMNSTLKGTSGKDKFIHTGGTTTIIDYNQGKDSIKLYNSWIGGHYVSGNDVIFKTNYSYGNGAKEGKIIVKNGVGKIISIESSSNIKGSYYYPTSKALPKKNSYYSYGKGTNNGFNIGSTEVNEIINGHKNGFSFHDENVILFNATAAKEGYHIYYQGNNHNNIVIGGDGETSFSTGSGNNNFYLGTAMEKLYINGGKGSNNVIWNYTPKWDVIRVLGYIKSYKMSGSDVILYASTGETITVKDTDPGDITVYGAVNIKDTYWYDKKLPKGLTYDAKQDKLTVDGSYEGYIEPEYIPVKYKNLDTSKLSTYSFITMDSRDNTIWLPKNGCNINSGGGNDIIYAGAGSDTINYGSEKGKYTIYNFGTSDVIQFYSDCFKGIGPSSTGTDVLITTSNGGKITLKSATGKTLNISNLFTYTIYVVGRNDANNIFTWDKEVRYIGAGKTDTLNVKTAGGTIDLTNTTLYKSIDVVNASKATKAVTIQGGAQAVNITGSNYNDTIKAGSKGGTIRAGKGNDAIYAGAGADTIQYAKGEGNDTIYNLSSSDKIKFVSDSLKSIAAASTGTDVVVITISGGKMTLKAATGKTLNVVNSAGTITKYVVGRNDANNTFTWVNGVRYIGTGKTDTLNVNTAGGTIDLTNTTLYKSINAVNASKATKAVTIKGGATKTTITGSAYADTITGDNNGGTINGGAGNDIITAGSKGNTINGGAGNDIIKAGTGIDTILISNGMGTDTVTGFSTSDRVKVSSGTLTSVAASATGTDVVVTAGTGKVVLKSMTGKTVQVMDNAGAITKYVVGRNDANNTFTWASGMRYIGTGKTDTLNVNTAGGTVDLTNTTLYKSIDVVNASKATKAVTIKGGSQKVNITGSAYDDILTGANVAGGTVSGGAGNDTIKAGSKGGTLIGGKGNDKIYAGAGADVIKFAAGDGNDTVYNFSNSADTIRLTSGTVKGYKVVNGNGVITTDNGTITLSGYKANSVYVTGSDGVKKEYKVASNAGSNVTGTTGKDVFTYTGLDLNIINYGENSDIIKLNTGKVSKHYMSGKDVIFEVGSKKITVKDGANKIISVVNSDGVKGTYLYPSSDRLNNWYTGLEGSVYDDDSLGTADEIWLYNISGYEQWVDFNSSMYGVYSKFKIFNATNVIDHSINFSISMNGMYWNGDVHPVTVIAGDGGGTWNGYEQLGYGWTDNQVVNYYGSAGIDTFYAEQDAVINNYTGNQDKIQLKGYNDKYISGYDLVGNDVILKLSSGGSITVKDVNPGEISVYISNGKKDTYWYDGILPEYMEIKGNTVFILNADDIPSSISIDELAAHYNENIKNVDTTKLNSKGLSIYGDYRDNIIKTGDNGSTVYASGGNDTIYLNSSKDVIVWSGYYGYIQGNTTVYSDYNIKWSSGSSNSNNGIVFTYDISDNDIIISNLNNNNKLILKNKASGDISFLNDALFVHKEYGGDYTTGKNVINYDGTSGMIISNYDISNDVITINSSISAYNVIGHDAIFTISGKKLVVRDGSAKDISFVLSDGSNVVYNLNANLFKTEEGVSYDPITDTVVLQDDYVGVGVGTTEYYSDMLSTSYYGVTNIDASAMTKKMNIAASGYGNIIKGSQGGNSIYLDYNSSEVSVYCNAGTDNISLETSSCPFGSIILYDFDAQVDTVNESNAMTFGGGRVDNGGPGYFSYYYSGDDLVVISESDVPMFVWRREYVLKNGKNLHYITNNMTNGGTYYYQSTLGCMSASIGADTLSSAASGNLTGKAYQPGGALSQGVTVNTAPSELAKIQQQYS